MKTERLWGEKVEVSQCCILQYKHVEILVAIKHENSVTYPQSSRFVLHVTFRLLKIWIGDISLSISVSQSVEG